jgi:hypothetical protein
MYALIISSELSSSASLTRTLHCAVRGSRIDTTCGVADQEGENLAPRRSNDATEHHEGIHAGLSRPV